ncbi:uncharacterized protein PHA67_020022 isoform 1-T1 [Liasis olivaceus]
MASFCCNQSQDTDRRTPENLGILQERPETHLSCLISLDSSLSSNHLQLNPSPTLLSVPDASPIICLNFLHFLNDTESSLHVFPPPPPKGWEQLPKREVQTDQSRPLLLFRLNNSSLLTLDNLKLWVDFSSQNPQQCTLLAWNCLGWASHSLC